MSNWVIISPTSGQQDGSVTITASTLTEAQDRSGEVRFYNNFYGVTGVTQIYQYYLYCTAITLTNVSWVSDIPASGGTASKDNCSYSVIAYFNDGTVRDITDVATVTGSLEVDEDYTTPARHSVGTLTLTASYENEIGTTLYSSAYVNAYQQLQPSEIEEIEYYAMWWSRNIQPSGATVYGTANRDNCYIILNAVLKNGVEMDITNYATYSGSVSLPTPFSLTEVRMPEYPLTITAEFLGFTVSKTVIPIIAAASANDISGITFGDITWRKDIDCTGGTITRGNCHYSDIYVIFTDNTRESIYGTATVTYSPDWVYFSMIFERHSAGTGTLSAELQYDGSTFTTSENFTIWQDAYDYYKDWLTFENTGSTVVVGGASSESYSRHQYSFDSGRTWSTVSNVGATYNIQPNTCVKIRGVDDDCVTYFNRYQNCIAYGNAYSVFRPTTFRTTFTTGWHNKMFSGASITSAEHLILQATGITNSCYTNMFLNCQYLTTPPELPATIMAMDCYNSMFKGCSSLTTAPSLPATTLDKYCYESMFDGCTSLTTAPALPTTAELPNGCYKGMFNGCTGLTDASITIGNSGTVIQNQSCMNMFWGCSSLVNAPSLPSDWVIGGACYSQMFVYCTSLVTAPALPARNISRGCYSFMFGGCTSLVNVPASLPSIEEECYMNMFSGCTSLVTAPALPSLGLRKLCYSGMFAYCSSLVNPPALPASILTANCYNGMFAYCTSLEESPILPAESIPSGSADTFCYAEMFKGCTSLKKVTCYLNAQDTMEKNTTKGWMQYVPEGGNGVARVFIKNPNMTNWTTGNNGIQNGWIVQDASYSITAITIDNLTWVNDIPVSGGTADSGNCSFTVNARYDDTRIVDVTSLSTISGSSEVSASTIETRHSAGTLTLTASYSGFTVSDSVTIMQRAYSPSPIVGLDYLTLTIVSGGTINWVKQYSYSDDAIIYYSINDGNWTSIVNTTAGTSFNVSSGDFIKIKGEWGDNYIMGKSLSGSTAYFNASGNVLSLYYGDDFSGQTTLPAWYNLGGLFRYTNVINASGLILPSTLSDSCYNSMFWNCTSLVTAPALPATALTTYCYSHMFYGCTGLTTAPELPATTLVQGCYEQMFYECSSLNYIKCLALSGLNTYNCTYYWLGDVSATGTFVKNPNMSDWTTGASGIPTGWTVEDAT